MLARLITILSLFTLSLSEMARAQVPTEQDCLGAIPVCQNVYQQNNSYTGQGNYTAELNAATSCLSGVTNEVWYVITVQNSGDLSFVITPNNANDDYDWAVFNLSNNNCSDLFTNTALEVSCNNSGIPGPTGPTGGTGQPFEPVLPVTAGETYVIYIMNFSSTQNGYLLDFSASTAQIFDNIPPEPDVVAAPVPCGSSQITLTFSENILCNTIDAADFEITGPGGPYSVLSWSSIACAAGADYTNEVVLTLNGTLNSTGTYNLNLIDQVTDLCGNPSVNGPGPAFQVTGLNISITLTQGTCFLFDAEVFVNSGGVAPFTYAWSTIPVQNTSVATNLGPGTYSVTVTDVNGCQSTESTNVTGSPSLQLSSSSTPADCGVANGSAEVTVTVGTGPFTYAWNPAVAGNVPQALNINSGTYVVTVTDPTGCQVQETILVSEIGLGISISSNQTVCTGQQATLTATVSGGTAPYTYNWSGGLPNQPNQTFVPPTSATYTVSAVDANGCTTVSASTFVSVLPPLSLSDGPDQTICEGDSAFISVLPAGGDGIYTLTWTQGFNPAPAYGGWVKPAATTIYDVTLNDQCGTAPQTGSITVTVVPAPTLDFVSDQVEGCIPLSVNFSPVSNAAANSSYYWLFGDQGSSVLPAPLFTFQFQGCIDVSCSVIDATTGCKQTITKPCYIRARPVPSAPIIILPEEANLMDDQRVLISSVFETGNTYSWQVTDGQGSSEFEWFYFPRDTGIYPVKLTVSNEFGCFRETVSAVRVTSYSTLYIPNAFTPNGDGDNDVFIPATDFVPEDGLEMQIYNRWGEEVFSSVGADRGWDGAGFPQGVYVYFVKYRTLKGDVFERYGLVSLLR